MDGDLRNLVRAIPALKDILNKAVRIVDIHKIKTQVDGKDFPLRKSKTNDKC